LLNIIGGLSLSVSYNSQFNYLSDCAIADDNPTYFGIYMGIVQSANILGNLLSAYTVEPLGQKWYCIMMTIIISAIAFCLIFIREVDDSYNKNI
jgi:hypothetical protein